MKYFRLLFIFILAVVFTCPAFAANRFILRPVDDTPVNGIAGRHGLTVLGALDDDHGSVFLVAASDIFTPDQVIADVSADLSVVDIEEDKPLSVPEISASPLLNQSTTAILDQISAEASKQGRREMPRICEDLKTAAKASPSPQQVDVLVSGFDRLVNLWQAAKSGLL